VKKIIFSTCEKFFFLITSNPNITVLMTMCVSFCFYLLLVVLAIPPALLGKAGNTGEG
jgi:hypothetical protein